LSGRYRSDDFDPSKLRQSLLNLLSNAAKFTRNGVATMAAARSAGDVTFRVTDTGTGMTPAQTARLFAPFTQVHDGNVHGGAGLGLAITKRFCTMMGGDVTVYPDSGRTLNFRGIPYIFSGDH
jgi:signal transduction histidine kinase